MDGRSPPALLGTSGLCLGLEVLVLFSGGSFTSTAPTWSLCSAEHLPFGFVKISKTRELQASCECEVVVKTEAQGRK